MACVASACLRVLMCLRVVSCVQLADEDVMQVVGKTVTQQKHDKNYAKKVQAHWDAYKAKKKKAPLKS